MKESVLDLIKKEGWEVTKEGKILVYNQEFPIVHPCLVHLKLYRTEKNADIRYTHMKAAHDYLWPGMVGTWNYWDERRFRAHCEGFKYISYAGGASTGKSDCAARIVDLYFLADPRNRTILVASTTLDSLNRRIFGYCIKYLKEMTLPLPYKYYRGNSPHVLYDETQLQHGIFAVSAKQGDDERTISTWIGRKAKGGFMLVLDEGTDMPLALTGAFPNLEQAAPEFQCTIIGNSNSKYDLHGVMSTPKDGWQSINPTESISWETTKDRGVCLYFNAYESPAIHEPDARRKRALSKIFLTEEGLRQKELQYGKDSDAFYRFTMGFWRSDTLEPTIVNQNFLETYNVNGKTEWLGLESLNVCAGLDPAFSSGGDTCVLRLALLGQTVDGGVVLDFKGDSLLFRIPISAKSEKAAEIQVAEQVIEILGKYRCNLKHLCIDANGQGRALGGTLQLQAKALVSPTKIYSVRVGNTNVNSFDVKIMEPYDLWSDLRKFIENNQIKGLDHISMMQLTKRLIVTIDSKGKPCKPKLENKSEFKRRMGSIVPSLAHSPDEADAAALCLQSAILHFGFKLGQRREVPVVKDFAHEKMIAFQRDIKMEQQKAESAPIGTGFSLPLTSFKRHGI